MKGLKYVTIFVLSQPNNHQVDRMANPSFSALTFTNESISLLKPLYFSFDGKREREKEREIQVHLEANLHEQNEQSHGNFALLSSCLINEMNDSLGTCT